MAKYVGSTVRSRSESDREIEECNGTEVITMEWNELQTGRQEAKRLL